MTFQPVSIGTWANGATLGESWIATGYREQCTGNDGYFLLTHGMAAAWTTDPGQGTWIGAATEVEGQ